MHLLPGEAGAGPALSLASPTAAAPPRASVPDLLRWCAGSLVRHLVDPVLAVVFPAWCPSCRALVSRPTRGPLCESCWGALPRHRGPLCRCGFPLPSSLDACGRCRRGLSPFARGASLGPYEGALRLVIHELKYRGHRRLAGRLASELSAVPEVVALLCSAEVLVPVPLHPRRQRERGFNQSALLARALARAHGLRVAERALARVRETPPQTTLGAAARRANVAGAFSARDAASFRGRVVVLVDDVLTTGATARACAGVLRRGGAREVRLLTVARA